jgi:hypothetical protein
MRHSDPKLTANTYTHLALLDVSGAVNRLPGITAAEATETKAVAEIGSEKCTPFCTLPTVRNAHSMASFGTMDGSDAITQGERKNVKNPLFSGDFRGNELVGRAGVEPATLGLRVPCSTS